MDRSTLRLPDPDPRLPHGERRRSVRQKLHTPVYASFNGGQTGPVVDLSELLDLDERGFSVQTSECLEVNRALSLCLDLTETGSYVHGSGQVVWSDDTGRAGIRFSYLPDPSRRLLKEWLLANLLIASTNYAARTEQIARHQLDESEPTADAGAQEQTMGHPEQTGVPGAMRWRIEGSTPLADAQDHAPASPPEPTASSFIPLAPPPDPAALFSALDDLRCEVRAVAADADAVLRLITSRALAFTGARGAALALLTDGAMLCRARAGDLAPPLGSVLDVKEGLSGECIRSGVAVSCEDAATDPRVDPELCRTLGLGCFMAVPIFADFRVVGLLEIFAPHAYRFTDAHSAILDRLVELVPKSEREKVEKKIVEKPEDRLDEGTEPTTQGMAVPEVVSAVSFEAARLQPRHLSAPTFALAAEGSPSHGSASHEAAAHDATSQPAPSPAARRSSEEPRTTSTAREKQVTQPSGARSSTHAQGSQPEERPSADVPERAFEPLASPGNWSRIASIGLLCLAIAVVALVLGYLLAPVIERRLVGAAQSPIPPQAESASSTGSSVLSSSLSRASWQAAANRKTQHLSLQDLRAAAEQGDPEAQWGLGILYHNGEGVPQDDAQAVHWFLLAAEQAYRPALSALGSHYWSGRGVPQDYSKAYFWFQLALAEGDQDCKPLLEGLATQMTHSQVSDALQQAEAWLHSHNQPPKPAAN